MCKKKELGSGLANSRRSRARTFLLSNQRLGQFPTKLPVFTAADIALEYNVAASCGWNLAETNQLDIRVQNLLTGLFSCGQYLPCEKLTWSTLVICESVKKHLEIIVVPNPVCYPKSGLITEGIWSNIYYYN